MVKTSTITNNSPTTTSILNINREESFVVQNSIETTQRFPGPSYNVGPIDQDALFHNELLQRRGLIQTIIPPETIESVERTQLEIPTSITNHVDGSNFVINNIIHNTYNFNLNSFPVQIEGMDSIILGFNNSVRTGFMRAISSIRHQELSNVEAVRASMQRNLDAIRLEESQALPLTINNNLEISNVVANNN